MCHFPVWHVQGLFDSLLFTCSFYIQLMIIRATQFHRIHLHQSSSTCSILPKMGLTLASPGNATISKSLPSFRCHIPTEIPRNRYDYWFQIIHQVWLPHANTFSCWEAIPHPTCCRAGAWLKSIWQWNVPSKLKSTCILRVRTLWSEVLAASASRTPALFLLLTWLGYWCLSI